MIEVGQHPVRRFGPTAWVVLQELSDRGVAADGGVVAFVSIRDLALQLGLSKNTVQRALGRLSAAGLIEACQRRTTAGTFSSGHYAISANATDLTQLTTSSSTHVESPRLESPPARRPHTTSNSRSISEQPPMTTTLTKPRIQKIRQVPASGREDPGRRCCG